MQVWRGWLSFSLWFPHAIIPVWYCRQRNSCILLILCILVVGRVVSPVISAPHRNPQSYQSPQQMSPQASQTGLPHFLNGWKSLTLNEECLVSFFFGKRDQETHMNYILNSVFHWSIKGELRLNSSP